METDNHRSVTLSVSHKNMNCDTLVKYLTKTGIMASVTNNKSIICENISNTSHKRCFVENGCRILFNSVSKKEMDNYWHDIKYKRRNIAHIDVPNIFSGCIYDYLQETKCPGQQK